MIKKIISTDNAPSAIGPYSQAILAGNMLFTSGQIAIDPKTGALNMGSVEEETTQVMNNMSAVLSESGATFENVVKTSIFLKNMGDFNTVNEIYASYFEADYPARETVQVAKLPKDVNVEISMIALL